MYYTTDAHIDRYLAAQDAAAAEIEWWDENYPDWREQSVAPEWEAEPEAEWPSVSDEDWEAMAEAMWVDPAERDLD